MAYTLKTNYADKSNYGAYRSLSKIKYIVWHYTGNDGDTDEANAKFFKTANRNASAHYFVDDDSVTISVPDTYVAWSVGDARWSNYKSTGGASLYKICTNTNSISIELCDTQKNGTYDISEKTLTNAIELTRNLMEKYNISINNVIRHFDVSGKTCPAYYVNNTEWNKVKMRIVDDSIIDTIPSTVTYTKTQFIKEVQSVIGAKVDGIAGNETLSKTVTVSKTKNRKHPVVKPIQKYLASLGYNVGEIDGIAGTKFDKAVKEYQRANTGVIDGEITARATTWKKLLGLI